MPYFLLSLTILTEVAATLLLKSSNGWEKWWLGIASICLYSLSGVLLAFVLKTMSVGIAYTIWSGAGIALVCIASIFLWQQKFDIYAVIGIMMIFGGSMLITLKSSVVMQ